MVPPVTDATFSSGSGSGSRRTTVPHPQRWRSPQEAGWQPSAMRAPRREAQPTRPLKVYGRPVRRFRDMIVYAARPSDGECWNRALLAELEIFAVRNGWASPESQLAGQVLDYVPYTDRSEIFVATTEDDPTTAIGVARMIWGTSALPLEEQFLVTSVHRIDPEWHWMLNLVGLDRVSEWATLGAVGSNLSPMFALWSAAYRSARARNVDFWVQSIVEVLFTGYRDGFKLPMQQIGEREVVVGAESIPTVLSLEEIGIGRLAEWDPQLKREIVGHWAERRPHVDDPDDFELTR
jgi:hypothetical protein